MPVNGIPIAVPLPNSVVFVVILIVSLVHAAVTITKSPFECVAAIVCVITIPSI